MKFCYASYDMFPALENIWRICFHDTPEYIKLIFGYLSPENIFVALDSQNNPVSILFYEPFTYSHCSERLSGVYIFGVATLPQYRGQNLATELLQNFDKDLCRKNIPLSVLLPADDGLRKFYEKRGYHTHFYIQKFCFSGELLPSPASCIFSPTTSERFLELRSKFYQNLCPYVQWNLDYLNFIRSEAILLHGNVLEFKYGEIIGYLLYQVDNNAVFINEITAPPDILPEIISALHYLLNKSSYTVRFPIGENSDLKDRLPFAMLKWYDRDIKNAPPAPLLG